MFLNRFQSYFLKRFWSPERSNVLWGFIFFCHFGGGKILAQKKRMSDWNSCSNILFCSFPIEKLVRVCLRGRLLLRRKTVRRIPWIFGACDSHTRIRYSCQHSHFWGLLLSFQKKFCVKQNVPLPKRNWSNEWIRFLIRCFGGYLKPRYIFSASTLDQWALTLSSKDGCFQAHLLVVFAYKLLFPLRYRLGTLSNGLGCFPFDERPLHLSSVCFLSLVFDDKLSRVPW